jgi:RNA-directed DNA polymerase
VNIGEPWPDSDAAWARVLKIQTKLHQWATDDPQRRFDDLYNLVYDPAVLVMAWERVRGNRGARSAGVDGVAPRSIVFGAAEMLGGLRDDLKARRFEPLPVRERMIPRPVGSSAAWASRPPVTGSCKRP